MKVIIVGAGEVGFHIASHLARENKNVVVIDKDPAAIRRVSDNIDVQVVIGSGSSPVVLKEAGIKEAEILLAVTDSDDTNLGACLVSNLISPATKKLCRIRYADYDEYHEALRENAPHIDTIINPEIEVVKKIFRLMSVPGAVEVNDFADGRVVFIGIYLDEFAKLSGVRLSDIYAKTGKQSPLIAAVVRDEELIIPRGQHELKAGDLIYFISKKEKLVESLSIFDKQVEPIGRVMIVGGGSIGFRLASLLEENSISTKIIEKNPERCTELAEKLNKAVVLHGDGSDQELLREENIQDMDIAVMLTNDEETNILASLLAKRMGASKAITKVNRFSYLPLMAIVGIEKVVSPRLSAINSILRHIRRGKVLSVVSIKGEQAEIIEAVPTDNSAIILKPLKNIALPKGVLVTGIIRGERVMIPSGESVINPNDRIIIFAKKQAIQKLDKILPVKTDYF